MSDKSVEDRVYAAMRRQYEDQHGSGELPVVTEQSLRRQADEAVARGWALAWLDFNAIPPPASALTQGKKAPIQVPAQIKNVYAAMCRQYEAKHGIAFNAKAGNSNAKAGNSNAWLELNKVEKIYALLRNEYVEKHGPDGVPDMTAYLIFSNAAKAAVNGQAAVWLE